MAYGCGKCIACVRSRRRIWAHRIILEACMHHSSAFVTLTYSDDKLIFTKRGLPTLSSEELQLWVKRMRKSYGRPLRFYGVGEYSPEGRPHYHVVLFGYPCCPNWSPLFGMYGCECEVCERVRQSWGRGHISVGTVTPQSAAYVAGYVTKKIAIKELQDRCREFARMSLRPGIGAYSMNQVSDVLLKYNILDRDVPSGLRHGSSVLPLGRYLRQRLRLNTHGVKNAPAETIEEYRASMRPVFEYAKMVAPQGGDVRRQIVKNTISELSEGTIASYKWKFENLDRRGRQ